MLYTVNIKGLDLEVEDVESSTSLPYIVNELNKGNDYSLCHQIEYEDGDIIIDLGANIGLFSIMMAKLYPQIKIIALEALEINYKHLISNIERANVSSQITAYHLAVTGDGRDVIIGSPPNCTGGAALHYGNYGTPNLIKNSVKSISLSTLLNDIIKSEQIRVLKIDIEGSEFEVLESIPISDLQKITVLVGEFHFIRDIGKDPKVLFEYVKNILGKENVSVRIWGKK